MGWWSRAPPVPWMFPMAELGVAARARSRASQKLDADGRHSAAQAESSGCWCGGEYSRIAPALQPIRSCPTRSGHAHGYGTARRDMSRDARPRLAVGRQILIQRDMFAGLTPSTGAVNNWTRNPQRGKAQAPASYLARERGPERYQRARARNATVFRTQ